MSKPLPTGRIETISDGVIAIIVTVMIFDLKISEPLNNHNWLSLLFDLAPKFTSYLVSFVMISVIWVNHHQLFHQIKHTDRGLLWYNIHLLFWMSLVPFATSLTGQNPGQWQAASGYGFIFFFIAKSFTMLRNHVIKHNLLHQHISLEAQLRVNRKNRIAMTAYLAGAAFSLESVFISYVLYLLVPVMYFMPHRIVHETAVSEKDNS